MRPQMYPERAALGGESTSRGLPQARRLSQTQEMGKPAPRARRSPRPPDHVNLRAVRLGGCSLSTTMRGPRPAHTSCSGERCVRPSVPPRVELQRRQADHLLTVPGMNETPRRTSPEPAARTTSKLFRARKCGGSEVVGDRDQRVRVGALSAVPAHCRGDGPDRGAAVTVHPAGDVSKAICCGRPGQTGRCVDPARIVVDRLRNPSASPSWRV